MRPDTDVKIKQRSDLEDSRDESLSDSETVSPGARRRLKRFVNKRSSDAVDLLAVYMLSKGLDFFSDY